MIQSKDRSYYIGASDTNYVTGNYETASFAKWYGVKQGFYTMDFTNAAMKAGTAYEHKILESLDIFNLETDRQIIIDRLRVNLDGNTHDTIYEVKTHNIQKEFKVTKQYRNQANVEMYAFNIRKCYIVSYALTDENYNNYFLDIDKDRIKFTNVDYDEEFINGIYLPRYNYISHCLDSGSFPTNKGFEEFKGGLIDGI